MQRQNLRAKAARKYKGTTNSKHDNEGWLYLAVIIDLFSRLLVGWAMAERVTAGLVWEALQMALWRRNMPKGVILHSDSGSRYCLSAYQNLMAKHQLPAA